MVQTQITPKQIGWREQELGYSGTVDDMEELKYA